MEAAELLPYAIPAGGFVATGAVALWRLNALERKAEKRDGEAREDRRQIHEKINKISEEMAEHRGYHSGKDENE